MDVDMIEVGQTVGNYRITAKLGEGGMGMVFRAEHPVIGRRAALKAIHPEFARNADVISRFVNEAKAISQIGHEHIVDITDFGRTEAGDFYFIMEYLSGEVLSATIHRAAPFPPARALAIAAQIADALDASHAQGVVHRDLKPENVFLIPRSGTRDFVKVLDFGLAKLTQGDPGSIRQTSAGMIMGTPYYMSPEQCEGRSNIDHRADIYALGVILFEMLTGKVPFGGDASGEILVKHVTMAPPAARAIVPGLPASLDVILHRALAKRPDDRFPSMAAFRAALLDPMAHAGTTPALEIHEDFSGRVRAARPMARAELGPSGLRPPETRTTFREGVGAFASDTELARPARGGGRGWLIVGAMAVAGVLAANHLRREDAPPMALTAALPAPANVRLTFGSDPTGAEVVSPDGDILGTTPLSIEVPASDAPTAYLVRKDGYADKPMTLIPNVPSPVFALLAPVTSLDPPIVVAAPEPPRARPARHHKPASRPAVTRPRQDETHGDDVLAPTPE